MNKRLLFIAGLILSCLVSCKDIKLMQEDISDLQNRVETIESQLSALQNAYDEGKIIKDVVAFKKDELTGWTITFSDNESIVLYNGIDGEDGVTPIVIINEEGYWEVSYDNGETFSLIIDESGDPVLSKGEKGNEGLSVRIVIDEDGMYIIECFYASDPDTVIDSILTPCSSDPANQIASILKDPYSEIITLTMKDGSEYVFNLDVTFPTSIVVLAESVVLPHNGNSAVLFRVNPSNAVVDLNLTHDNPMFELDKAIATMTRSYVTPSSNYYLQKIEPSVDAEGNAREGQYVAYISNLGLANDFCEGATIVLNSKDGRGNDIQVSSDIFKVMTPDKPQFTTFSINGQFASDLSKEYINVRLPYGTNITALTPYFVASEGKVTVDGKEILPYAPVDFSSPVKFVILTDDGREISYIVSISYSNIPVVYVNTKNAAPIVSKEEWLKETEILISNAGSHDKLYTKSQIRGRGNSTWDCPKKPYAIKLDEKDEVLGMPKHKRWVLLANYFDKSCIRNSTAFEIARRASGIDWTPRGYHVDVIVNGTFLGNYYLCEQIKIDENRVNTDDGFLLEIDKHYDEVNKFMSPIRNMPFMIKEPDEEELTPEQFTFIQNYVTEIENALYSEGSTTEKYMKYINLESFVAYWLVYELTSTGEPTHPKSVYMWADNENIFHAGPVWDFDYFTFQPYYNTMLINTNAVWNDRIINDPNNQEFIRMYWKNNRVAFKNIADEMRRQYKLVRESAEYNAQIWSPLTREPNKEENMSVDQIFDKILGYYETHFNYIDLIYNQ